MTGSPDSNNSFQPWWEAPHDEAPAVLAATRVIASEGDTAIALTGARVYSNGLELHIDRVTRRGARDDAEWKHVIDVFMERPYTTFDRRGEDGLRYAVRIDDLKEIEANNLFRPPTDPNQQPAGYSLMRGNEGAHGNTWECISRERLWLWPLPVGNALEIVVRWPAMGVSAARARVGIHELPELSAQSQPLWP